MTDRETLLHTVKESLVRHMYKTSNLAENITDDILASGVIVPPIKVGTKVYVITSQTSNGKNLYIFEDTITHYIACNIYNLMCFENHLAVANYNWDKVFLTKEEAEEKLQELKTKE